MRVSQAIEMLSALNADDEIAISWWTRDLFTDDNEQPISEDRWSYAVDKFDSEDGYDSVNQEVWNHLWITSWESTGEQQ
jgi:hypothetical protein